MSRRVVWTINLICLLLIHGLLAPQAPPPAVGSACRSASIAEAPSECALVMGRGEPGDPEPSPLSDAVPPITAVA